MLGAERVDSAELVRSPYLALLECYLFEPEEPTAMWGNPPSQAKVHKKY